MKKQLNHYQRLRLKQHLKNQLKMKLKPKKVANEPEFKNKTDRMKHKKVNCKECGANLTLKTLRYSHKCSKTEDKEIKQKPKTKAKPKAVEIQPSLIF